jgi:hypothetical protein
MEGTKVIHPVKGPGVIEQMRNGGFELLVMFIDGSSCWVRNDELIVQRKPSEVVSQKAIQKEHERLDELIVHRKPSEVVSQKAIQKEHERSDELIVQRKPSEDVSQKVIKIGHNSPKDTFQARRMVEAFRLGIVPYDQVDGFTFGRNAEVGCIKAWLGSTKCNVMVLSGEYGSGKSHLLSYTANEASRSRYAVALVETDSMAVPFYKPKSIFRQIVRAFEYTDVSESRHKHFRDFLTYAINKGAFADHKYFKWLRICDDEGLWDWISCVRETGRPMFNEYRFDYPRLNELNTLPPSTNAANVYCYLLSSLGWAARNILGLAGLLVIFDEAESVDLARSSFRSIRANNFIKALVLTANNDRTLLGSNWDTGLDFSAFEKYIPFMYRPRSEMKVLFATTPFTDMQSRIGRYPYEHISIEGLPDDALRKVYYEIYARYIVGFPGFNLDYHTIEKVWKVVNRPTFNIRKLVKASVEAFDIVRLTDNKTFLGELS